MKWQSQNLSAKFGRLFLYLRFQWLFTIFALAAVAKGQALTPAWVELGENGRAIARIVVSDPQECPAIQINRTSRPMALRQPLPPGFRPVCEFAIPSGTKSASVNGHSLVLPKRNPARIVVIGDTGCRIKGHFVQDCNHPDNWPFLEVAASAAREKAEMVLHVGDYLYRESPCPEESQKLCGGSPAGDNWDAWNADFFTPAAELLSGAPWAFVRGNHEDCSRTWRGWFYYLDPRAWDGKCAEYPPAYLVKLGKFQVAILDTSAMRDSDRDEAQVAQFSSELASLRAKNAWLATHYPFWGFAPDFRTGKPMPLVATLQAAWEKAAPTGYSLILGGHVHLFEYISVDQNRPPQLVAGDAGTLLDVPIQASMKGVQLRGARVTGGQSREVFGYILMTRSGKSWHLELKNRRQNVLITCTIPGSSETCQTAASE